MQIETIADERDRRIYEDEFRDWLPHRILDAHVHVFDESAFPATYVFPPKSVYRKFGCRYTLEDCLKIAEALLPGHEYAMLSFGNPDREADIDASARYTGTISDNSRYFGLSLIDPSEPVAKVEERIRENRLLGYKPYHNLVRNKATNDVTVFDMVSPEQMELADRLGLVIMFHIPRAERLADPLNQRQMVEFCRRYPNVNIIWAHIGRAYFMRGVQGFLDGIAACPNAYIDTAMVNHPGVLEYAFRNFPRERILFGSDAPIAWLRGKSVEINHQYAYLMGEDYAIGSTIYDAKHVVSFTSFFYEQLRGIREGAEKSGLSREELNGLFFENARRLLIDTVKRNGF
jgi:predicted TIM-barrel fold metal-dependent hydrolase